MATFNRKNGIDTIVVGAGVVGCSLAYHLVRRGARVRVFDRGGVCAGMSARSGALIRMHYTFLPEADLALKSLRYFQNWSELVGGACGFVRTGFVLVVGPENTERLRGNLMLLRNLGINTYALEPAKLKNLEFEVNVSDVALAAYEPESGYADPVATTESFAEAAKQHGVSFALNTPIAAIQTRAGRAAGVIDDTGRTYEADAVCIASGPWTDRLLKPFGVQIGIKPQRAQLAFFQRAPALTHCAYIDTIAGCYFRPHDRELTLAGLGDLKSESDADPDRFRENNDDDFVQAVSERLARRVPRMRGAPCVRGHAGIYDTSPDSRAVLGSVPDVPGLFVAAGFSGTGFKTSPAVGAAMAELITVGTCSTTDLRPFGFERLQTGNLIRSPNEYVLGAGLGHVL